MLRDGAIYRALRWLNEHGHQGLITGMLWRWRASAVDRTALKQRVRRLERFEDAVRDVMYWMEQDDPRYLALEDALRDLHPQQASLEDTLKDAEQWLRASVPPAAEKALAWLRNATQSERT